jgi:hypothetical protein
LAGLALIWRVAGFFGAAAAVATGGFALVFFVVTMPSPDVNGKRVISRLSVTLV